MWVLLKAIAAVTRQNLATHYFGENELLCNLDWVGFSAPAVLGFMSKSLLEPVAELVAMVAEGY